MISSQTPVCHEERAGLGGTPVQPPLRRLGNDNGPTRPAHHETAPIPLQTVHAPQRRMGPTSHTARSQRPHQQTATNTQQETTEAPPPLTPQEHQRPEASLDRKSGERSTRSTLQARNTRDQTTCETENPVPHGGNPIHSRLSLRHTARQRSLHPLTPPEPHTVDGPQSRAVYEVTETTPI